MSDRELREVLEETQRRLRDAEAQLAEVTAMQTRMAALEAALARAKAEVKDAPPACLRCGSTDVVRSAPIAVRGRSGQELFAVALGDPLAAFDKEPFSAELVGNVCGQCGTIEIGTPAGKQFFETWKRGVTKQGAL